MPRIEHLQIKIMHLAAEAGIIKGKERKKLVHMASAKKAALPHGPRPEWDEENVDGERKRRWGHWSAHLYAYQDFRGHRIEVVRKAARDALIAYGYLRGRTYRQIENKNKTGKGGPDWNNIIDMIKRFGSDDFKVMSDAERINTIMAWRDADEAKRAA